MRTRRQATGLVAVAFAAATVLAACSARGAGPVVEIDIRYSRFEPAAVSVPAGVPVTVVIRNGDPIDHEWIVGDDDVHARHRTGTEPAHAERPTEVSVPAGAAVTTIVAFAAAGTYAFICHLPGHEAYGMVGTLHVTGSG